MSWWEALDANEWRSWLLELTRKRHVPAGQRLDPFGTSMRSLSRQAVPWLRTIQVGGEIEGQEHRVNQAFTDMGSIDLVSDRGLTPFSAAFLDRTSELPTVFEYELPFMYALLMEAIEHRVAPLLSMLGFWWDVRKLHPDDALLRNRDGLLLVSYLNQALAPSTYNPWAQLRRESTPLEVPIDWGGIKGAISNRTSSSDKAVETLRDRVSDNRRFAPRVVFCTGMDLVFERHADLHAATAHLEAMKLPVRHDR
jgi:hypothetical protein